MSATIYYYTGENSVDLSNAVKRQTDMFQKKHSVLSMSSIDALHDDEQDIKKALASSKAGSLFGDINLVVLKNILSSKKFEKNIEEILEKRNANNFFLFVQDEKIEDTKNEKRIKEIEKKKEAVIKEFHIPTSDNLAYWAIKYAKNKNVTLSMSNAKKIITAFPSLTETKSPKKESMWFLAKEIDKLISFSYPKNEINEKAITEIVEEVSEFKIFSLTNAIIAGKKTESITLLEKRLNSLPQTKHEAELRMIFAMLQTSIRKLLLIKNIKKETDQKNLASIMGWTPQHLSMLQRQVTNIPEDHIQNLQKKLIDLYETAIDEPKNLEVKTVVNLLF